MTDISTLVPPAESNENECSDVYKESYVKRFRTHAGSLIRGITVELALFFALFCEALRGVTQQTLLVDRVCRNQIHYSDNICDNILNKTYKTQLLKVQDASLDWKMINNLLLIIPTVFMSMVIGAWSDKHGRKFPLFLPLIGGAITQALLAIYSYFKSAPVYMLTLSLIPSSLFGIFIAILISLSYISDITTKHERTSRIAYLEGFSFIGYPLGTLVAGLMFKQFGFTPVFVLGLVGEIVAVIYVWSRIKETRGDMSIPLRKRMRDFLNCNMFVESCKTFTKKREGTKRSYIVLLLISLCCFLLYYGQEPVTDNSIPFYLEGLYRQTYSEFLKDLKNVGCDSSVGYFYSQLMFDWDDFQYSLYQTLTAVFGVLINLILIPVLSLYFGVSDISMGAVGALSAFVNCMVFGYAFSGTLYYIGKFLGLFAYNLPVVIRSFMSKIVGEDELGKVFAFVSMVESLCPVLSSLLYLYIYKLTEKGFPSGTFFIGAFFMVIAAASFLWMDIQERRSRCKSKSNSQSVITGEADPA
ncbi:Proton-coupled folate transporter [Nymphon striatum]|nr:Proton-coupled folate transporter [Nymphon striatum]